MLTSISSLTLISTKLAVLSCMMQVSTDYKLNLMRYTEFGRGLADCFLMQVGATMRCFSLVLFSEKYSIGAYKAHIGYTEFKKHSIITFPF